MAFGTGRKVRTIKAFGVDGENLFEFNRSIDFSGGVAGRMTLSSTKRGHRVVKIYQDLNDDGKVSKKELIYKGKSRQDFDRDELVDFDGDLKLEKSMHMCDWMILKNPDKVFGCTLEYIPTSYELTLLASSGDAYSFEAIGRFADPSIWLA